LQRTLVRRAKANAPVVIIAEKGADMVREDRKNVSLAAGRA
jgi:hypothetical protein